MDDNEFDRALIGAAFDIAAERGWDRVTVAAAARRAELKLDRARARFPGRPAILLRFGRLADLAALAEAPASDEAAAVESARDQLFAMLMRRIDLLQAHRAGVLALMRFLPGSPGAALLLKCATERSMAWLLDAAGIPVSGVRGVLRAKGLLAVWLLTLRAWSRDESADLSATMRALDEALRRAERMEEMMPGGMRSRQPPADDVSSPGPVVEPTVLEPEPPAAPPPAPPEPEPPPVVEPPPV
ncbi:MAG: TetR family transcriptional regulator [Acetobacteraceae bacterium]|nr:TetR family transcriptional regulator [Acetobacteraceae bacterium]